MGGVRVECGEKLVKGKQLEALEACLQWPSDLDLHSPPLCVGRWYPAHLHSAQDVVCVWGLSLPSATLKL